MNFQEIPDHIVNAEPMTAGELRKKIKNLPADTKIYIVVDKVSEDAWDDEKQRWRYALPLVYANREKLYGESFGPEDELNLLLEYESE